MTDLVGSQIKVLLIFCLSGVIIGTVFDFFRLQRKLIRTKDVVTYIQDALFWVISSIVLIITVVRYTDGEIRSYMVLGVFVGVCGYFLFISKYYIKIGMWSSKFIKKTVKIIIYPFTKLIKILLLKKE